MIYKLICPAAILAFLLLVAEILNLSVMQHFGAILSIVGIAFCFLARMSARSRADRKSAAIAFGALILYVFILVHWILLLI